MRLCKAHQPAGRHVKPMDQECFVLAVSVPQGIDCRGFREARSWLARIATGLVDHDQVVILEDDHIFELRYSTDCGYDWFLFLLSFLIARLFVCLMLSQKLVVDAENVSFGDLVTSLVLYELLFPLHTSSDCNKYLACSHMAMCSWPRYIKLLHNQFIKASSHPFLCDFSHGKLIPWLCCKASA